MTTRKQAARAARATAALAALAAIAAAGCGGKTDDTLTAAPPPDPGAKPLPAVERKYPRPKLPPLVGKDGQRPAARDF